MFSAMASTSGFHSFDHSDSTSSRAGYTFSLNDLSLQPGDIPIYETIGNNEPKPIVYQYSGREHNVLEASNASPCPPFVNGSTFGQGTQHMPSEMVSIMDHDVNLLSHHPKESECRINQGPNSYSSCIYSAKESVKTDELPNQFQLPLNYDQGIYPLGCQVPEALPSINTDMFADDRNMMKGTYSTINQRENVMKMNQNFYQLTPLPAESSTYNNKELDFKIHQIFQGEITERHLLSLNPTSDFSSNPKVSFPSIILESSSNKCLNLYSQFPEYDSTADSNTATTELSGTDPDIAIVKDLHPSIHQLSPPFVRTRGLQYLKNLIDKRFRMSKMLNPLKHRTPETKFPEIQMFDPIIQRLPQNKAYTHQTDMQTHKSEISEILQFDEISLQVLQNISYKHQVKGSKTYNQTQLQTSHVADPLSHQTNKTEPREIRHIDLTAHQTQQNDYDLPILRELLTHKSKATEILRFDQIGNQVPLIETNKYQVIDSPPQIQIYNKSNTKFDSPAIQSAVLDTGADTKNPGLISSDYRLRHEMFVKIEDLHKLFLDVAKSEFDQMLNSFRKRVNVFVVGLSGCDSICLIKTFARSYQCKIFKPCGLAFQRKISSLDMLVTVKCWHLKSSDIFDTLRTFDKSSRNVIILVYDVTRKFKECDINPKIDFLKGTNLPILLVGNTSRVRESNGAEKRVVTYRNGLLMREMY